MNIRRFIIPSRCIRDGYASLDGDLFKHIVRVLRMNTGDILTLVDERGDEHLGVIDQIAREWIAIKIIHSESIGGAERLTPQLTICQAIPKGEKIDLILQKGTELGVHEFWIFGGLRSVVRVGEQQLTSKLERWNRISAEASRQCGRLTIPVVSWFPTFIEATEAAQHELRLLLSEKEHNLTLRDILAEKSSLPVSALVAIGPEGGFEPQEVNHFVLHGFTAVSLGKRILRTETAAIAIAAILQYTWQEI